MSRETIPNNETSIREIKPFVFDQQEIETIRRGLSGEEKIPENLSKKIQDDPLVRECSMAIFFPVITEHILKNGEHPKVLSLRTGARHRALKVSFEDESYVIKSVENSQEPLIAKTIAEIGIGPEQFKSFDGYLTEKFIEGSAINQIDPQKCTPEYMENIGKKIGGMVKKVHGKNILINDQLFSDDFGKSHTIITREGNIFFIDFGASVDLTNFPDISDESVGLIIRSDTFAPMGLSTIFGEAEHQKFINQYRKNILNKLRTKEEVINRYDGQLLTEGFSFLSQRIPHLEFLMNSFNNAVI